MVGWLLIISVVFNPIWYKFFLFYKSNYGQETMDYIRYYHIRIFTGGYLYILQIENNLKKIRWTIMLGLSKSEYQILYSLYDVNR